MKWLVVFKDHDAMGVVADFFTWDSTCVMFYKGTWLSTVIAGFNSNNVARVIPND